MTNPARAVLFDLDGTLVDPAGAITGGILAALLRHGVPHPGGERLEALVGPPLAIGLLGLPGMSEELLPSVIADYRAEYAASGMSSSRVYPGIAALLAELRDAGRALAVATSKPQDIAVRLLEIQGLLGLFDAVHGSPSDEHHTVHSGPGKAHIVEAALAAVGAHPRDAVMVGDRHYDVDGAGAHGMACIGVAWGYAAEGELETAGAHAIVDSADELREMLLGAPGRTA